MNLLKKPLGKNQFFQILTYLLFLLIGIYFLKKTFQDPSEYQKIGETLSQANIWVLLLVMLISVAGHLLRSVRWKLLLNNAGEEVLVKHLYWSLLFGYFINYLVPRLGEIYRCVSLNRVTKIPTAKILATVMVERLIDVITLFLILPTVFFIMYDRFEGILQAYVFPFFLPKLHWLQANYLLVTLVVLIGIGLLIIINRFFEKKGKSSEVKFIDDLWEGFISLKKVKRLPLFLFYTLLIWLYYFVTNYACLFALDSLLTEKWPVAVSTGTFGSIGKSLPIAGGGMGAYHKIVTEVLLVYGVSSIFAKSMSIIFHGSQLIFQSIMGIIGGVVIYGKK